MGLAALPQIKFKISDENQFTLKGNRVLIECKPDTETYGNGVLYKPEKYRKYARSGWVRAFGDEIECSDEIMINDLVYFNAYAGYDTEINGKDFKITEPENLLCRETRGGNKNESTD